MARLVEGDDHDLFVLSVRANTNHGKPLTLAERERAARRILASHGQWSDRAIAGVCGLSSKTVGYLRTRSDIGQGRLAGRRIGRDGKSRPIDANAGRRKAASLLQGSPGASLREVARQVGLSPATVKDVRDRLHRGEKPEVVRAAEPAPPRELEAEVESITGLRAAGASRVLADAAIRSSSRGEALASWLAGHAISEADWSDFVEVVPTSRIYEVVDCARAWAAEWQRFADALEGRLRRRRSG